MQKPRDWLPFALVLLGVLAGATTGQAATLVEHNAIPQAVQQWNDDTFSSSLEPSGAPEFGTCVKTTGGAYSDSGCTGTGAGKNYEWYAAFGSTHPLEHKGFSATIKEGTTALLETVGKTQVLCEGEGSTGEYTGNKTVGKVVSTFTNCSAFGHACTTAGAAVGTIVTGPLEGVIGVEETGAEPILNKIGQDLFPIGHTGSIAEFVCSGVPLSITGSIISPVTPNAMKLTTQVKTKQIKGKQKPEAFVGETPDPLMANFGEGAPEQAGETLTTIQTNEEKVEVNSVL
ncbi:MAG TPA: hypothetical protein VG188_03070 [Solirubrobacteraceae bacterium]|jgi:hypothetical protein|nr:hypothetical protein [Solirubrobacteraceae bacterium]